MYCKNWKLLKSAQENFAGDRRHKSLYEICPPRILPPKTIIIQAVGAVLSMGNPNSEQADPKFICDDNLGKLTRYLRVAGYDTLFFTPISDGRLLQLALDDQRHILSRDRRFLERTLARDIFIIADDHWPDQLRAVMTRFGLTFDPGRMLSRCLEDNSLTQKIDKTTVEAALFPYTFSHFQDFRQCPTCKRIFWSGSHIDAMVSRLRRLGFIPEKPFGGEKGTER